MEPWNTEPSAIPSYLENCGGSPKAVSSAEVLTYPAPPKNTNTGVPVSQISDGQVQATAIATATQSAKWTTTSGPVQVSANAARGNGAKGMGMLIAAVGAVMVL